MTTNSRKVTHVFARWIAARQGCAAGRQGLSVEEVADTAYLARLRRDAEADLQDIAAGLAADLDALHGPDCAEPDCADILPAQRAALIAKAKAAARVRVEDYHLLCGIYGGSWRRHHRDRRFVHLGWRCPELAGAGEVHRHEC